MIDPEAPAHPLIHAFESLLTADPMPLIGKKAESLISLLRQGVPVPPGAALEASALEAFLHSEALLRPLESFWQGLLPVEQFQAAILAAPLPPRLELELMNFLAAHPDTRWAVRSSGVQEDLADASFAGLYSTVLNVTGSVNATVPPGANGPAAVQVTTPAASPQAPGSVPAVTPTGSVSDTVIVPAVGPVPEFVTVST